MIPEIKKILYATDLSESAQHSFGYAASLSDRYNAGITVLHVLEDLSPSTAMRVKSIMGEERWLETLARNKQDITDSIRKRLEEFCDEIENQHATCSFKVDHIIITDGQAVATILETAKSTGCSLIVMGTHGYGSFKEALMGSTARRVVRRSPVPVMIVRQPK